MENESPTKDLFELAHASGMTFEDYMGQVELSFLSEIYLMMARRGVLELTGSYQMTNGDQLILHSTLVLGNPPEPDSTTTSQEVH